MANFFDRFDIAPDADLTQPQGGMTATLSRKQLEQAAAPPPPPKPAANYFDRFDGGGDAPPAQPKSWLDSLPSGAEVARQLKMGAGYIPDAAGAALGFFANPLNTAINATTLPKRVIGQDLPTNVGEGWGEALGAPQPQNAPERLIKDVGVNAGAGLLTAGAGMAGSAVRAAPGLARSFAQFLAEAPVVNTVAGGTGGLAAGGAREAGAPDWVQMLAGLAGGLGGGVAAGAAHAAAGARPLAVPIPESELLHAPLEGTIGDTNLTPDQVGSILNDAGAVPGQFSSPEIAAAMAQRAEQARAVPPANFEGLPVGAGKGAQKRYGSMLDQLLEARDQGALPPRVVPDDVSMIAAPEGTIRSDDAGGIAGVERKRAADSAVLDEAGQRVASDPVMSAILDSNVSPQVKVATVWERLRANRETPFTEADMPAMPDPSRPFQQPTPQAASEAVRRDANPLPSRIHDITLGSESSGRRYGSDGQLLRSPKGAQGEMQVMPGTSRDPGYGVRPARDGSADELARVGRDYIDALGRHYGGDMEKAWAAYNAGPGAVDGAISKYGRDWLSNMPAETRAYVNKNMAALGGKAEPLPFRAADYSATNGGRDSTYSFDAFDANQTLRANRTENMGAAERPESFAERQAREQTGGPMGTGDSTRPFRVGPDDGEWEARANASADELYRKAQDDLNRRWEERAQADREAQAQRGADDRFQRERANTENLSRGDPSALYRGKYDQRPAKDGEFWRMTDDGYVAGKSGNPVAFRNAREAAKWAASERMGGDVEFVSWGGQDRKGTQRVALQRREGSSYGVREPVTPQPVDTTPRLLDAPQQQPVAEPASAPASATIAHAAAPNETITAPTAPATPTTSPPDFVPSDEARVARPAAEPAAPPRERMAEDALTFIARKGGLRDDEGHDLRGRGRIISGAVSGQRRRAGGGGGNIPTFAPGGGHMFRKAGMSIDQAGEALHEAGYFGPPDTTPRPTPAEVLDMLDRSSTDPVYRTEDIERVQQRQAAVDNADWERQTHDQLQGVAADHGMVVTDHELDSMRRLMARGMSADDAFTAHHEQALAEDLAHAWTRTHAPEYDPSIHEGDAGNERPSQGTDREGAQGDRGSEPPGRSQEADAAQPERPRDGGEQARAAADEPGSQPAAGEERGTDGTGRVEEPAPAATEQDRQTLRDVLADQGEHPATDEMIRRGFMERAPGADRARLTDRGQAILRPERKRPDLGDSGFITADMLTAPFRAVGKLLFDPEFLAGDRDKAVSTIARNMRDPKGVMHATGDRLRAFGEATAYSTDSAIRSIADRFNAPTLGKLADLFHAEAGKTDKATGRTFGEAVSRNQGRFMSQMNEALHEHLSNDASMARIRDLLATPNKAVRATAAERATAGKIRDLLSDVLDYRRDAGEAIGEVKDGYFPRQLRQDRVYANPEGFLRAAEKAYREIGADDPAKAAAAYLQRNMDGHLGIADGVTQGAPGASSTKAREFGKAADEHLREFYDTNPLSALTSYVTGAVKRAEETRRFGAKGREGSPERAAWEKEHGDRTQWDVMREAIQSELRANGARSPGLMDRIEALRTNSLGKARMVSPKVGSAVSVIHAWNQLSTLGRAMISSIPEMSMGFVRAGPKLGFTHLRATMTEFARNVRKAPPSDAARYAEAAGAIGSDNALHLLRARADDPMANAATAKLLDQFYRKNGLEQWTRAGRTAAVATGQRFMDVLAHDMTSTSARTRNRAAGYLRELGISDPEKFAATLRSDKPSAADLAGDSGHAAEYATALLRFANQTVLMPSRSTKPAWASHPVGSLVFALQSYNYAFKKNVLDRVGRLSLQAFKERDPAKLAAASGLVVLTGVTALVQGLRGLIYGSPVNADKETPLHYALETMDRTGLFGAASPIFNAFQGLKYQRSVGQALQGSVLGRTADGLDALGGLATNNNENTNSAERKAAAAFYDLAVKPAESAIGAGVLRGALGSAVILGSGVRNNDGLLPADRSAFVDTVGGEKKAARKSEFE